MPMRTTLYALALAFALAPAVAAAAPQPGSLIKGPDSAAVYYYAADGKRYVFPNEKTYLTWYANFSSVLSVTSAELAAIPIGGNVTYRPGARMVKVQTDPKVYVVARGGELRHVDSESVASSLYGSAWNTQIDDLPDPFFVNYTVGAPVAAAADYDRTAALASAPTINEDKGFGPPPAPSGPVLAGCRVFPADNPWNTDVSGYPVHANSAAYIASIGASTRLHPDFGEDPTYGIPFEIVGAGQAKVPITFDAYGDESDPGPYPIPPDATVEAGGDQHVLVVDSSTCKLYELFAARKNASGSGWTAAAGAVFDLNSNALRPDYWTSADAAGLPILPGLVRFDEAQTGAINHAIRFTASPSQRAFIHPATHYASSSTDANFPPMGLRVRLKANYDISGYAGHARAILEAMKRYGMILADNGGDWYFQGEMGAAWDDGNLNTLKNVPGSAFEAVETGPLIK